MFENVNMSPQDINSSHNSLGGVIKKGWNSIVNAFKRSASINENIALKSMSNYNNKFLFSAGDKFELSTKEVLEVSDAVHKLYTRLKAVRDRVNNYDVNVDGNEFNFGVVKNKILANIDAWLNKFTNTENYIRYVVSEHESLQKKLEADAPDLSYIKKLINVDGELENRKNSPDKVKKAEDAGGGGKSGGVPIVPGLGDNSGGKNGNSDDNSIGETTNPPGSADSNGGGSDLDQDKKEENPNKEPEKDSDTPNNQSKERVIETTLSKAEYLKIGEATLTGLGAASIAILTSSKLRYNSDGYAMIGNRYLVKCDESFGNVGDAITLVRGDKTHVDCLVACTSERDGEFKFYVGEEFDEKNLIDVTKTKEIVNYGSASDLEEKTDESGDESSDRQGEESSNGQGEESSNGQGEESSNSQGEESSNGQGEESSNGQGEESSNGQGEESSNGQGEEASNSQNSQSNTSSESSYVPPSNDDRVENNYNSNNYDSDSDGNYDDSETSSDDNSNDSTANNGSESDNGNSNSENGTTTSGGGLGDDFGDEDTDFEEEEDIYDVSDSEDEVVNTDNKKKKSVGPVIAGLGLAGAAGVGTKILLDKKKEQDEEEDDEDDDFSYSDNEDDDSGFVTPNSDELITDSYDNTNYNNDYETGLDAIYGTNSTNEDSSVDIMDDNNTINNVYSIPGDRESGSIDDKLNALSNVDGDDSNGEFNENYY